ncbi:phage tail tape measure protein [Paenibacillus sp. USDA918EY]|uniref:phage tail tape measure protein n=1 Tax=Paenibacillus sp. USDA918EY TaxID=2689575 RepID=UPI00135A753A|nr:phage tail tape measure protein [Paenibacillus sp. USDA918EY]
MAKKYEMSFELNGDIDHRLLRTFDTLSHEVTELKTDFNSLRRTRGLDKVTADAEEASGAFRELREQAQEFREVFDRTLQFTGAHTIISTVGDMFSNMISEVGALDDSVHQMGAATGATAQEMAQFKDIIQEIYNGNYGEGFRDIADSLVNVKQVTGLTGDALEEATKKAIILRDTFGYDINESVRTVDALMRNMGLTADQAFNLIAQGTQRGLNRYDDFLDTINEYSVHFKDAGYNAEQMFSILESGSKSGTWNLDKMGDLLKEFNIRIRSGDDNINDTMAALFAPEGIENFIDALKKGGAKVKEFQVLAKRVGKDTAKEMIKDLNGTAKKSQKAAEAIMETMSDSGRIFEGLANGSMQAKDALNEIIGKLDKIDDINYRNKLSVDLFGTQYEDLKGAAVDALKDVNGEYDKTLDTMQQIEGVKYSSLTKDIQKVGRELMTNVVIPIGEDLMPMLQDLSHWASDNKDLVKTLALGVPAAMLTKNAVSMSKDFAKVGKSFFDTTNGVSKFGRALTFLTNPVGIAVGALGLITTGVIAYKKHQEEARQALIHMGDTLQKSFDDYSSIDHTTKRTQNLIREYDRLTAKIKDIKTPANELTEARRKLAAVEKELIELNPEILHAEDAKNSTFRDQLNALDKLNQTKREMMQRDIEADILNKESQLPSLVSEYKELQESVDEYNKKYLEALNNYQKYNDYVKRQREIISSTQMNSPEQVQQLNKLADEIREQTGNDYRMNWANLIVDMQNFSKEYEKINGRYNSAQADILEAEKTYQDLYNAQVKLIEMQDLGGQTIQNQAAQYSKLTADEKQRFDQAIAEIQKLNNEMDDLPLSKKIDLNVIWRQAGFDAVQAAQKSLTGKANVGIKVPGAQISAFAEGGRVTSPTLAMIGEAGDEEFVIPVNNSPRSRGLYAAAGEALGLSPGGSFAPVYNPQIIIQGNADEKVVRSVLNDDQKRWEQNMAAWQRQQQRRSLV